MTANFARLRARIKGQLDLGELEVLESRVEADRRELIKKRSEVDPEEIRRFEEAQAASLKSEELLAWANRQVGHVRDRAAGQRLTTSVSAQPDDEIDLSLARFFALVPPDKVARIEREFSTSDQETKGRIAEGLANDLFDRLQLRVRLDEHRVVLDGIVNGVAELDGHQIDDSRYASQSSRGLG